MTSIIFGIVLMCLLVAAVILVFKPYDYGASVTRFKKIGQSGDQPDDGSGTEWRCARIRPGLNACHHAADLKDQVFLCGEEPELPLAGCNEQDCRCHYVFLDDRRSGIDRRAELATLGEFLAYSERDRRLRPGRRIDDLLPA